MTGSRLLFIACAAACTAAGGVTLDGIAARVDSYVITVGDVLSEIRRRSGDEPQAGSPSAEGDLKARYAAALDSLVERRLVLKAAEAKKMELPEWVIDNQIREIVHDLFGGDMNKLEEELHRTKMPMSEYRGMIKDDITVRAMRQQIVDQYVTASPAAMKREYENHPERYTVGAKATVRVILLRPGSQEEGVPSISTRWEQIGEELAAGESFADAAIKYSADSHAAEGGLWKDVDPEEAFRPEIAKAIASLRKGEVSRLIDLDGWGFVVKKESGEESHKMTFKEAYDMISANVRNDAAKKAYGEWIARLKDDAFVQIYDMPK